MSENAKTLNVLISGQGDFTYEGILTTNNPSTFSSRHLDGEILNIASAVHHSETVSKQKFKITFLSLETEYKDVTRKIPEWHKSGDWDAMIHLGASSGRRYVSLETGADRLWYCHPDDKGEMCPEVDGNGARGIEGKVDRWNITFDHEPMVKYLKDESGHSGVAVSSDAGDFVCSFILATSLKYAELTAREKLKALRGKVNDDDDVVAKKLEIPVMFVHLPALKGDGIDGLHTEIEQANILRSICKWIAGEAARRKEAWANLT